jgi:RNA 2',3'-cyclic 3'-phosphodiesterase
MLRTPAGRSWSPRDSIWPMSTAADSPVLEKDRVPHRLFFALWPDAALRDGIAGVALQLDQAHAPGGRRLHPSRYHLTLAFLGDVEPSAARTAGDAVRAFGFDLRLDRIDTFPGNRILWLGMDGIPAGLSALSTTLANALARAGVHTRDAAAFVPHVTLQRGICRPVAAATTAPLHWHVRDFVLADSVDGAYRVIGQWPLMD